MKKLAIITTHPVQYNAPVFKLLSERKIIQIKVFYTWENARDGFFDKKFNLQLKWDIPLLEGYDYQFVKNTSKDQGTHHRRGIINPTLVKDIKTWNADAILVYGWNFRSHFKVMRYFKGKVPVLFRGDSTLLDEKPGIKTKIRCLILKLVYRYIDYALYVGSNNKNYFLKHGIKEKQLILAPHAIDNERFSYIDESMIKEIRNWKEKLKIAEKELVFLYAGKFEKKKDPTILLKAIKRINNKAYKVIFAGDGELKNKMQDLAKEEQNVCFLSFQNQTQMPALYRLADVFVLPSKGPNETWGLVVNEAMASGKAVLVSNKVGCAIDLVKNGENGFIFEAGNLSDLISKMSHFDKNSSLQMGEKSKLFIKKYNFGEICNAIETKLTTTF